MNPNLQLLESRHEIAADELSEFVSANFGGNLLTLRQLEPYIVEIKRRFKTLPRKMGVDGTYKTISGHRSFKSWCQGVLKRTDRTVRYMLAKSKNEERKSTKRTETISAVLSRCMKYIEKQELDEWTKTETLRFLAKRLEEHQHYEEISQQNGTKPVEALQQRSNTK